MFYFARDKTHQIQRTTIHTIYCIVQSIIDNNLLLEIMEFREEIEQASSAENPDEKLDPLLISCQSTHAELCEQLASAFREDMMDEAKVLTAKLKYWSRVEEMILEQISVS